MSVFNSEQQIMNGRSNTKHKKIFGYFKQNYDLYLMLIPGLALLILFRYTPMYGLVIAFKDYNIFDGIAKSKWVGLYHIKSMFSMQEFYIVLRNTMLISLYKLIINFPLPIIFALLLNEIYNIKFKRTIQTIIYLPHFLSWVILSGVLMNLLSSTGIVNNILYELGLGKVNFFMDKRLFRSLLVLSEAWKNTGWETIIYIAAITSIDQNLYCAAKVDGANRFRQIWHITLPGISATIIILFILRIGHIMEAGTEQILMMYNPLVYDVADVIGTYVIRMGLNKMNYSFSAAVGFFNSVVGFILMVTANSLSRRISNKGIW